MARPRFYDASGERMGQAAMTPRGHALEAGLSAVAAMLSKVMTTRDGWHPDELCAQCSLRASDVNCALLELELTGLVHNGFRGYETVAPI